MDKTINGELLKGFDASIRGHNSVTITHLLFANVMLFFCDVDVSQVDQLRQILIWF